MKTSTAIGALAALVVVGGGIALVLSKKDSANGGGEASPRVVKVYSGYDNNPDLWAFDISQSGTILYGPKGPFQDQAAAQTAGDNWLAEHPIV